MLWDLQFPERGFAIVQTAVPCSVWYRHCGCRLTRLMADGYSVCDNGFCKVTSNYNQLQMFVSLTGENVMQVTTDKKVYVKVLPITG